MTLSRRTVLTIIRGQFLLTALTFAVPAWAKDGEDDSGGGGSGDSGGSDSGGSDSGDSGSDDGGSGSNSSGGGNSGGSDNNGSGGGDDNGSGGGNSDNSGSGSGSTNNSGNSGKGKDNGAGTGDGKQQQPRSKQDGNRVSLSADAAKEAVRSGRIAPLSAVLPVVRHRAPGRLLEVNLLHDSNDRWRYEVLVLSRNGAYQEVTVDGVTKAIVSVRRR
jgi:hypothetical protein